MASDLKSKGQTMLDRLQELRCEYGYYAQQLKTFEYEGEDGAKYMASIMTGLRQPLSSFEQACLKDADRTDYLIDDTGLPKSDVIEFRMKNGNKVVVRPSGTEPKLKAYLFASGTSQAEAEKALDSLEEIVNSLCR